MEKMSYQPGTPSWVDIGSPDPAAAAEFYSALFGWDCVDSGPEFGGYLMCVLRGVPVAGIGSQQLPGRPFWTTYVSVTDAATAVKAACDAGGQVLADVMAVGDQGSLAVLADPSGAAFSVWQPGNHHGAGIVNEPGALCWNELATRDRAGSIAFYGSVFGWTADEKVVDGTVMYTEWQLGGSSIGGMMGMDENWPADVPPHWMPYFAVADTDAAAARVAELGGSVPVPPTDIPQGRFAVVNDPHGAVFSVIALNPSLTG